MSKSWLFIVSTTSDSEYLNSFSLAIPTLPHVESLLEFHHSHGFV